MAQSSPHNPEAEATIIGRLILDPRQLALVAGTLQPEHFYMPWAGKAFGAMLALETERRPIDVVSVEEKIGDRLPSTVQELTRLHRGSLEGYAQIIRRDAVRRGAVRELTRALDVAQSSTNEDRIMEAVSEAVQAINSSSVTGALVDPEQAVEDYLGTLTARQAGLQTGLTWGIEALDKRLLPAQPGDMIVVGARPSIGKTALLEFIADAWARQDRGPVLFVSLEMSRGQLMDRAVARATGINTEMLVRGTLTGDQWRLAQESAERLKSVNLWVYDRGSTTVPRVRAEAHRVKMMAGGRLAAVFIDYLGLLGDKAGGDSEYVRISRISGSLKALARDLGVPVVVAAQFSRKGELRRDPMPILSDFRDSGAIEQDADIALGLHRTSKLSKTMRVGILKVRQGGGADTEVQLHFDYEHMTFGNPISQIAPAVPVEAVGHPTEDSSWD